MVEEKFLIDSNSFITPYRSYYAFDLIPSYWKEVSKHISSKRLIVLDIVKAEIDKGEDDLADWLKAQTDIVICNHVNEEIIKNYSLIVNYIRKSDIYNDKAFRNWFNEKNIADPWLIAAAKVHNYTIITAEVPSGNLTSKQPSSRPKIPDVAREFDVKTDNVFYMMRQLKIKI